MEQARPLIRTLGVDGFLIRFSDQISEVSNRAALAFRAALAHGEVKGVLETSTSLASVYLRFDVMKTDHAELAPLLGEFLQSRDWYAADLPTGRRRFDVPTLYGGAGAPQLAEVAAMAGQSEAAAVEALSACWLRVQTLGFAPGMPYLGVLDECWNIPRQTELTPQVPAGALCLAVRQMVLFPVDSQTGWRQIGRTHFPLFQPEAERAFTLRPGDELRFRAVREDEFAALAHAELGGARRVEVS